MRRALSDCRLWQCFFFVCLVQLVTEFVEFDSAALSSVSVAFWGCLVIWFNEYKHSNMLHNLFYRLLFVALVHNHEPSLQVCTVLHCLCRPPWLRAPAPHCPCVAALPFRVFPWR